MPTQSFRSSNGELHPAVHTNEDHVSTAASTVKQRTPSVRDKNPHDKPPKSVNNHILPIVLFELFILFGLITLASFLRFSKFFEVHESHINCCDASLMRNKSEENSAFLITINSNAMYCVNFLVPPGVIIITEMLIMAYTNQYVKKTVSTGHGHFKIPLGVRRAFRYTFTFLLGALCVSIWTDGMKYLTGRPRPYFYTACQPDVCLKGCTAFYTKQDCSVKLEPIDSLSFPSYYSSLSAYAALYIMIYLHSILSFHGSYSLRPTILSALAAWPLLTGYSRWMSNNSHWSDVLVGYIIGITFSIYMCYGMLNTFNEHISKRRPVVPGLPSPDGRLFDYYGIPRAHLRSDTTSTGYAQPDSENDGSSSVFEPNPAFQRELSRGLQDYRRKNYSPYAASSVGG